MKKMMTFLAAVSLVAYTTACDGPEGPLTDLEGKNEYRYVIIPASTSAKVKSSDYSNYSKVCRVLDLQE